jgi:hypothetical protein
MKNKLHLIQKTGRLTCNWVQTGNPKMPLACIWTDSKAAQAAFAESATMDEAGRMHLCA